MAAKAIFILCAQALLIRPGLSQYLGYTTGITPAVATPCGLANDGLGVAEFGLGNAQTYTTGFAPGYATTPGYTTAPSFVTAPAFDFAPAYVIAPASGGALPISSASPIAPSGLTVRSDNVFEGILAVTGSMPFVSAVAMEGPLPTAGSGAIAYNCGNGAIGIVSDAGYGATGANELAYGNGLAYGNDLAYGNGLGYGNSVAYGNNFAYDGVVGPSYAGCGCGGVL